MLAHLLSGMLAALLGLNEVLSDLQENHSSSGLTQDLSVVFSFVTNHSRLVPAVLKLSLYASFI